MARRKPVTTPTYIPPGSLNKPASYRAQSVKNRRYGQIGSNKMWNDFPKIIANWTPALSTIVVETTEDLADEADAAAPVGHQLEPRPGNLKVSLKKRYFRNSDGGVATGRIEFDARDPNKRDPYHLYAFYVEVGTSHTSAQPFLLPAVVHNRPIFMAKLGDLESRL